MKSVLVVSLLMMSLNSFAKNVSIFCTVKDGKATFKGTINAKKGVIGFIDHKDELGILDGFGNNASFEKGAEFSRNLRSREDNYKTAKFVSDYNAWQYLVFSLPKDVLDGKRKGYFTGYYDLMEDRGERFASLAVKHSLKCKTL